MKYTIEQSPNGYTETLEIKGKTYIKNWTSDGCGTVSCGSKEFWAQLEENGYTDEKFLDNVYDTLDGFLVSDIDSICNLL